MNIVCASSLTAGEAVFRTVGDVTLVPEAEITREVLTDADALVIRSKTRVTPELLDGTPVRFVGTATAGTDHMDLAGLSASGIAWTAAAGCNANSVSEYVLAASLHLVRRHELLLSDLTLGIIGVGHVGKKVAAKASALGLSVRLNDPPRELQDGDPDLLPLATVTAAADILSFHVPLNEEGPFRTRGMVDHRFFERLKPGCLFINASRGEVVDSDALLMAMDQERVRGAVLDVWEDEPRVRPEVLERADLGSPHIAGHSYEGKIDGTLMVYDDLCRFYQVPPDPSVYHHREPREGITWTSIDGRGLLDQDILWQAVQSAYDIEQDDAALRATFTGTEDEQRAAFNRLRRSYRMRREFPCWGLRLTHVGEPLQRQLAALGFSVSAV